MYYKNNKLPSLKNTYIVCISYTEIHVTSKVT